MNDIPICRYSLFGGDECDHILGLREYDEGRGNWLCPIHMSKLFSIEETTEEDMELYRQMNSLYATGVPKPEVLSLAKEEVLWNS